MFDCMNFEPVVKHYIYWGDLVLSRIVFMCSKVAMISLRYRGARSQVKACFVRMECVLLRYRRI